MQLHFRFPEIGIYELVYVENVDMNGFGHLHIMQVMLFPIQIDPWIVFFCRPIKTLQNEKLNIKVKEACYIYNYYTK